MKKFYGLIIYKLALSFLVVICCTLGASQCSAFAETRLKPLQTIAVTDSGNAGKASLYAQGQNYKTDVKLTVEFKNHKPYDIRLQDGYSQAIYTFDFGAQDKFFVLFFADRRQRRLRQLQNLPFAKPKRTNFFTTTKRTAKTPFSKRNLYRTDL